MADNSYKFVFLNELNSLPDGKYFSYGVCKGYEGEKISVEDPVNNIAVSMDSIFKADRNKPLKIFFTKEKDSYNVIMLKTIEIDLELFKRFLKIYYKWGRKYV